MSKEIEIDLSAVEAEIEKLSPEQLAAEVLKLRTQQKVQQKRNQGSDKHKAYQKQIQEKRKLMIAKAKELGIFDKINEDAEAAAEAKVKAEAEASTPVETEVQ